VAEIAELLGLEDDLDIRPGKLRSDLQQIVSLGRGLVRSDVAAILFDEPLTVIDQNFKWTLRNRLKRLHLQTGVTLVYVTHDQTEALTFADKVLLMNAGEVVQTGSSEDLFLEPSHEFAGYFIGSPGMNFLDVTVKDSVVTFEGMNLGTADVVGLQGSYRLGVRPEFVTPGGASGHQMTVLRVENRGGYQLIKLGLGSQTLLSKVESDVSVREGDKATFTFVPERTFLFEHKVMCARVQPAGKGR
jgi:glycerol transport system ATP-binding protein